jgi:hypothetical protein|tara:strand:- start:389 stop:562 length:174 start_codon:yes stop_codon:yes gene_type:complete
MKKGKIMKPLNEFIPSYTRNAPIVIPPKNDNKIDPSKIFEGVNNQKNKAPKKTKSKK